MTLDKKTKFHHEAVLIYYDFLTKIKSHTKLSISDIQLSLTILLKDALDEKKKTTITKDILEECIDILIVNNKIKFKKDLTNRVKLKKKFKFPSITNITLISIVLFIIILINFFIVESAVVSIIIIVPHIPIIFTLFDEKKLKIELAMAYIISIILQFFHFGYLLTQLNI